MAEDNEGSGGSRLKTFFTSLPGILTGLAALLTAIAAVAGVFLTRGGGEGGHDAGSTSAQNPGPKVEILSPQPGRVAWKTPVSIRYSHLGRDSELWLIERADKYYPQLRCPGGHPAPTVERLPSQQHGTWTGTIEIGPKNTRAGSEFQLLVLLTSRQASQLLSERIRDWCNPKVVWPGLATLPEENTEVKDTRSVFR
jgi:hypothetical protein